MTAEASRRSEAPGQAPTQLPRATTILLGSAAAVVVVAGMRSAAGIVGPAFLALMLTVAVHPLQTYLRAHGWPSWGGMLAAMATVYLLLFVMSFALVVSIARFATLVPQYTGDAEQRVSDATAQLGHFGVSSEQQQQIASAFDLSKLSDLLVDILNGLASVASSFLLLITLLLFMAIDSARLPDKLTAARGHHRGIVDALSSFAHGTRRYLVVSTIFGFIVAVFDTAALALLGVPAPFVWGVLAFITNYIPNIGFVIGVIPPALLALLEGGPSLMLAVIATYCVVNFVIQSVIQPKIVGDAVGLSGTMTMVSLVFWAWVLGALGALLAVPLTLLARALLVEADPRARWLLPLLSGDRAQPLPDPESGQTDERVVPGVAG